MKRTEVGGAIRASNISPDLEKFDCATGDGSQLVVLQAGDAVIVCMRTVNKKGRYKIRAVHVSGIADVTRLRDIMHDKTGKALTNAVRPGKEYA